MIVFSRHYLLGLIVGTGLGLFLGMLAVESFPPEAAGPRVAIRVIGLAAIIGGGIAYTLDVRRAGRKDDASKGSAG